MSSESILKSYAKAKEGVSAPPALPEVPQQTIPETIKKESKQFGEYLLSTNDAAIQQMGSRLVSGQILEEDPMALSEVHQQYLDVKRNSERMAEEVSGEVFTDMIGRSPMLQALCKDFGEDAMRKLVASGIKETAFTDRNTFDELLGNHKRMQEFIQKTEAPLDARFKSYSEKHKLSAETLMETMGKYSGAELEKQITQLLQKDMGFWAKRRDRKSKTSETAAADIARLQRGLEQAQIDRSFILKQSGSFIASLVSENPTWRAALGRVIQGEKELYAESVEKKPTLKEIRDLMPTEESVIRDWKSLLERRNIKNLSSMAAENFNALKEDFERELHTKVERELTAKGGFWAFIEKMCLGTVRFIDKPEISSKLK